MKGVVHACTNDVIPNVTCQRESVPRNGVKHGVSVAPKVHVEIFDLHTPIAREPRLKACADHESAQVEICVSCHVSGRENAEIVMNLSPGTTARQVQEPVARDVTDARSRSRKPIQILFFGEIKRSAGAAATGAKTVGGPLIRPWMSPSKPTNQFGAN